GQLMENPWRLTFWPFYFLGILALAGTLVAISLCVFAPGYGWLGMLIGQVASLLLAGAIAAGALTAPLSASFSRRRLERQLRSINRAAVSIPRDLRFAALAGAEKDTSSGVWRLADRLRRALDLRPEVSPVSPLAARGDEPAPAE